MTELDNYRLGERPEELRALDRYLTASREDRDPTADDCIAEGAERPCGDCPGCDARAHAPTLPAPPPANDAPANDGGPAAPQGDGYLAAPATAILATHCCLCGRALLDAASVERGLGPTCAKRAGVGDAAHPADWPRAARALGRTDVAAEALPGWALDAHRVSNVLVHRVGRAPAAPAVPHVCEAIDALGYHRLAATLAAHLVPVAVTVAAEEEAPPRSSTMTSSTRGWRPYAPSPAAAGTASARRTSSPSARRPRSGRR
jgi:hypothetical protein